MKDFIRLILIYVLSLVIIGIVRNEIILSKTPDDIKHIARFSGDITMIIIGIINGLIVLLVVVIPYFFFVVKGNQIKVDKYLRTSFGTVIVLIITELIKLIALFKNKGKIIFDIENIKDISQYDWYQIVGYIDLFGILFGIFIWGIFLAKEYRYKSEVFYIPLSFSIVVFLTLQLL